ncbi:MAG: OsmC family protein [Bacilli bacterium]|nr:OsmC family protein [Bacilli bacterium]
MATDKMKFEWTNDFQGIMTTPNSILNIGRNEGEFRPYELLFGSLGACFYATLLEIALKKRLNFRSAKMEISGSKRKEVPTTLEAVLIKLIIINPSDEKQFLRSAELSSKYCSIHETISKVADITLEVSFEYQ